MKVITVIVTGVGAIIGQGIIKGLKSSKYEVEIIGVDLNKASPGSYFVDTFVQKPVVSEDSAEYISFWQKVVVEHSADLIIPSLEVDMNFLDRHREFFLSLDVQIALNSPDLIRCTSNKWTFLNVLSEIGYEKIPSTRSKVWSEVIDSLGLPPFILKPLIGSGSRGIVHIDNESDLTYWEHKIKYDWLLQRYVGTDEEEYTVSVFGLGDGEFIGPLIFRRRLSISGSTIEADVIESHPIIEQSVISLLENFNAVGPTNLQFRVENDIAFLLEINPRFSSSNSLRTSFGFNEAEMAVDYYIFNKTPVMPKIKSGTAWRYSEDFVLYAGNSI
jgi:carbamoyl-phosphate synthase large subunit